MLLTIVVKLVYTFVMLFMLTLETSGCVKTGCSRDSEATPRVQFSFGWKCALTWSIEGLLPDLGASRADEIKQRLFETLSRHVQPWV